MKRKRKRKSLQEVNAGSMADIAFLLLVFFLVATTINEEKGIPIILPQYYEGPAGTMADRNVLSILINSNNKLLVEKQIIEVQNIRNFVKTFIVNNEQRKDRPRKSRDAVISLRNDVETTYETYVNVYGEIYNAYKELRNEHALSFFGKPYTTLNAENRKVVREIYPLKISESESTYSTAQN